MRYAVIDQTVLGGTPANVLAIVESENAVPSVEAGQSLVCDPPAGVASGWVFVQGMFAPTAPPPPPYAIYKTDVISRMTDPELDAFDAALTSATTRERRMWTDCTRIESDSPSFATLTAQFAAAFGADRAAILLAPST